MRSRSVLVGPGDDGGHRTEDLLRAGSPRPGVRRRAGSAGRTSRAPAVRPPGGSPRAPRRPRRRPGPTTFSTAAALISGPTSAAGRRRRTASASTPRRTAHEVVGDVGVHVEPVRGGARLAAVAELGDHGPRDGGLEVGVGRDHEGRVAAELHASVQHPVGGLAEQVRPTAGGAGEGDLADARVGRARR